MNRDDIIRMAREAGFNTDHDLICIEGWEISPYMQRFAALVISHHVQETRVKPTASEREMLQQIAYQHGGIGDLSQTEFEFGALVATHEREACARVCENIENHDETIDDIYYSGHYANAIRARGEK